jgi:hypothetical protein
MMTARIVFPSRTEVKNLETSLLSVRIRPHHLALERAHKLIDLRCPLLNATGLADLAGGAQSTRFLEKLLAVLRRAKVHPGDFIPLRGSRSGVASVDAARWFVSGGHGLPLFDSIVGG